MISCDRRPCAAIVIAAALLMPAAAQELKTAEIKGALQDGQSVIVHGYVAELTDLSVRGQSFRSDVAADGQFIFRNIPYGDYVLRITDYYGAAYSEQLLGVRESQAPVEVRLRRDKAPRPASGQVSLKELEHPPAPKAVRAALSGQRFAESGQYDRAAGELRKAVRISPDYAKAHSNLAVQFIRLLQYEQAMGELRRAMEIAGPNPTDLSNLAFAQTALRQYNEAAASARAALRIDPNCAAAHYILGTLLLLHNQTRAEGIAHLRRAAETMEGARATLARVTAGAR